MQEPIWHILLSDNEGVLLSLSESQYRHDVAIGMIHDKIKHQLASTGRSIPDWKDADLKKALDESDTEHNGTQNMLIYGDVLHHLCVPERRFAVASNMKTRTTQFGETSATSLYNPTGFTDTHPFLELYREYLDRQEMDTINLHDIQLAVADLLQKATDEPQKCRLKFSVYGTEVNLMVVPMLKDTYTLYKGVDMTNIKQNRFNVIVSSQIRDADETTQVVGADSLGDLNDSNEIKAMFDPALKKDAVTENQVRAAIKELEDNLEAQYRMNVNRRQFDVTSPITHTTLTITTVLKRNE